MSWILSAIAALVSWSLFFTVKFKENANPLIRPLSLLIGLLSSAVFLFQIIGRFAVVIPAGEVGVMESLGQVGQKPYPLAFILSIPLPISLPIPPVYRTSKKPLIPPLRKG